MKIKLDGHLDFRRVFNEIQWEETIDEFIEKYNVVLPEYYQLNEIGDKKNLWLLLNPLTIEIYDKGTCLTFDFKPGFIFNKTSIPVFKNNLLEAMHATMVHDYNFSCHEHLSFSAANKLFYKTCRYFGLNIFISIIYYLSVSSPFGRYLYKKMTRRYKWHNKFVKVSIREYHG